MRGLHLKNRGGWWYYQRRRPEQFRDVEPRSTISFSLKTRKFAEARYLAAEHSIYFDKIWREALVRGESLKSSDQAARYSASLATNRHLSLEPLRADEITDDDLITRLRKLLSEPLIDEEQRAVLGLIDKPALNLGQAFERFWDHIGDERAPLSKDQQRVKRNAYLKSIRNFEEAVGKITLYEITREHALAFRSWWMKFVTEDGYAPHTANRQFSALRRLFSTNADIDSVKHENPFARVRIKDKAQESRAPLSSQFISETLLAEGALDPLPQELRLLVRLLVNTGMRPSEAIGLEPTDIDIHSDVPFVHVRRNSTRSLKTDHSKRQLPLIGVSLDAARELGEIGGWGKWAGKNMYATTRINRHFRDSGLLTDRKQSLYSLRHWFQDQLTKRDVVDRAQAQLMGHKFQRPKYGYGKDISELREIIEPFAIK